MQVLRRQTSIPILVAAIGLTVSLLVWRLAAAQEGRVNAADFDLEAQHRISALDHEITQNLEVLHSLAAFHNAQDSVDRGQFQEFTQPAVHRHASIQALEWIPRVRFSERSEYELAAVRDGLDSFEFIQLDGDTLVTAAAREEYYPVYFVEPLRGNEAAVGFDLASNPTRLEALERARDSGEQVASGRIRLVQETESQAGFLVFEPIYERGAPTSSLEQRRESLIGFVLGVYRVGDMVDAAFANVDPGVVEIRLVDETSPDDPALLFSPVAGESLDETRAAGMAGKGGLQSAASIDVAGRTWQVLVTPGPGYGSATWAGPWLVLFAGLGFTALASLFLAYSIWRGGKLQEALVDAEEAKESLRESEAKYRDLFENASDLIQSVAPDGSFAYVNRAWRETLGYSEEDIRRLSLFDIIHPDCIAYCTETFRRVIAGENVGRVEATFVTKEGRSIIVEGMASCRFKDGQPVATRGIFRDITERKRAEEALREQARRDSLTRVLNHPAIVEELRNVISVDGDGASHAVAMVDVDGLKAVNDTYGHQVGDAMLTTVAGALSRDGAIVGRYGGDEFVAVLPDADRVAAERYRHAVAEALASAGLTDAETGASVPVVASIGLAVYPEEADTIVDLIRLADSAMYASRRQRPVGAGDLSPARSLGGDRAAEMVGQIVPLLTSPGRLEDKLRLMAHRISVAAGYDAVNVDIYTDAGGYPEKRNVFARVPGEVVETWRAERRRREDDPFAQLLQRTRRAVIVEDPQNDERLTETQRTVLRAAELRSAVVVPLLWEGELIGNLSAASKREAAFEPKDVQFLTAVATQVTAIVRMSTLLEELQSASTRLLEAQDETVILLAAAAEAHDHTTGLHLQGVRALTEALACELGYSEGDARELGLAAVLHDIGKIRVPDSILTSTGALADEEWELMKHHTTWGAQFLAGHPGYELAATIARSHHERWDGSGYPDGLSGDAIPETATIVAVADSFDAMTHDRPYRARRPADQAMQEILACSGKQFNPRVVAALEGVCQRNALPVTPEPVLGQEAAA